MGSAAYIRLFLIYLINFAKLAGVGMPDFFRRVGLADIALRYEQKRERHVLLKNVISAPLMVQRPFYPE